MIEQRRGFSWRWMIIGFCVFVALAVVGDSNSSIIAPTFSEEKRIMVNGKLLKLELAQTDAEVQQGLSDRLSMNADEGMLFYMSDVDIHAFWMHRMHFPLDMIWLRDGFVVEIAPNRLPPSETGGIPMTYTPKAEADMVLELTTGGVERYGLKIGEGIDI